MLNESVGLLVEDEKSKSLIHPKLNYIYKSHIKKYEKLDDDSFKKEIEKLKNIIK